MPRQSGIRPITRMLTPCHCLTQAVVTKQRLRPRAQPALSTSARKAITRLGVEGPATGLLHCVQTPLAPCCQHSSWASPRAGAGAG